MRLNAPPRYLLHVARHDRSSIEAARAAWRAAQSFEELCALGARFVRGESAYFPGWGSPTLDVESDAITVPLARLNELGLLTLCSQPGRVDADGGGLQRAFVCGFVAPHTLARLERLEGDPTLGCFVQWAASTEIAAASARGTGDAALVAVTIEGGATRVEIGAPAFEAELECFRGEIGARALDELSHCAYFGAWDTQFGAREHLWRALIDALERSERA